MAFFRYLHLFIYFYILLFHWMYFFDYHIEQNMCLRHLEAATGRSTK